MPMTRGERNNNPGNIRHVSGVIWKGESLPEGDEAFVQFSDPVYGIRAIVRILRSYEKQGIRTIHDAINRWAPPNENNSQAYVQAVCKDCGVNADTEVDLEAILPQVVKAIIRHENGEVIYTDEQIARGIELA